MIKRTRTKLANGLPVVLIEVPGSSSTALSFWTQAGTRLNPEGKEGLAHFLEHVLLKKTKKYPSDLELANALEKEGVYKNGWTNRDDVRLELFSPAGSETITSLDILSQLAFNSLVDSKGVEEEREIIKKEIARKNSQQDLLIWDAWFRSFFAGTNLEQSALGTTESLDRINKEDLTQFWHENFWSENSLLLVVGKMEKDRVLEASEKFFGGVKIKSPSKLPQYQYKKGGILAVEKLDVPQATLQISFRIPTKRDKDYYAIHLLRAILSLGWGSRFAQRLRVQEKLIYSRTSDVVTYLDTAALIFGTSTSREKFPKMVNVVCDELMKIKKKSVTGSEMERAKGFFKGLLSRSFQTPEDYQLWYGVNELFRPGEVESVQERVRNVFKVSATDILRVANKYITNDNWQIGVVGNVKGEDVAVKL